MTKHEIFRTAHRYIEPSQSNFYSFGDGLKHGINQICPSCKAGSLVNGKTVGDVQEIRDIAELKPWTDFYTTYQFKAYHCLSCNTKWSWYKEKGQE